MILFDGTTEQLVENALVEIARHVPLNVEIGPPRGANTVGDTILITTWDTVVWMVSTDHVDRYTRLGDGAHMITSWRWRVLIDELVGYDDPTEA